MFIIMLVIINEILNWSFNLSKKPRKIFEASYNSFIKFILFAK